MSVNQLNANISWLTNIAGTKVQTKTVTAEKELDIGHSLSGVVNVTEYQSKNKT